MASQPALGNHSDTQRASSGETAEDIVHPPNREDLAAIESSRSEDDQSTIIVADEESFQEVPAERLLLLTSQGPLVIDLHVTVAGQPFRDTQEQLIDQVLELSDTDQNGETTWDEIMSHPRFRYGQFGNPTTGTYQNRQDMVRLYDSQRNGRVDRQEVPRYLTSNRGNSASIDLRTSNYNREFNKIDSPTRRWLDTDGDRVLSQLEISQASDRLRARDADNDEILLSADFRESPAGPDSMRRSRRAKSYGPDSARLLTERTRWSELQYGLEELYARTGDLTSEDFPLTPELHGQLDIDQDGQLAEHEFASMLDTPPHIAIQIQFEPSGGQGGQPRIAMRSLNFGYDTVRQLVQHNDSRMTLWLPELLIDFFVNDPLASQDYGSQAKSLLARGDANLDQYIDGDEFAAVAQDLNVPLEAVDSDQDKRIYEGEIATFLQQRQAAVRGQLRISADDQADALFTALDGNNDGRFDGREIAQMSTTLKQLDRDGDGAVQLDELPGSMAVGMARGDTSDPGLFEMPIALAPPSTDAPRWFRGMDRNRDGGVSLREFLGTRSQFQELDKNQNGFIDAEEAG